MALRPEPRLTRAKYPRLRPTRKAPGERRTTRTRGPWPGWAAADERVKPHAMECSWNVSMPVWALRTDGSGSVVPERLPSVYDQSPPPPEAILSKLPKEVRRSQVGRRWQTIETDTSWLVTLNDGEFGAGLFAVHREAKEARRLDAQLPEPIRWVGKTASGIVAIAGLCHGEGCSRNTYVYHLVPAGGDWKPRLVSSRC